MPRPTSTDMVIDRPITADHLADALSTGQFSLAYQPKITIATNSLGSVEALARWSHPDLGPISPAEFTPLIEAGDLVHPFTEWVVATACADWTAWTQQGLTTTVAVNVSARNLARIDLPDIVEAECRRCGMPNRCLMVELTEGEAGELIPLLDTLSRFRLKEIGVSLDDYGTGHATAARFDQLPFSELKIDRSFVTDIDRDPVKQQAVREIVAMAKAAGIRVVAEGIETRAALDMIGRLGCDVAQGFFLARPMAAADLPGWARTHGGVPA